MRATWILFMPLMFYSFSSFSQKNKKTEERFYLWTRDWTGTTKPDSAAYLSRMKQVNDTCWQMDTWRYAGPMVSSEQFRDELARVPNGMQFYYHPIGYIDSTGPHD